MKWSWSLWNFAYGKTALLCKVLVITIFHRIYMTTEKLFVKLAPDWKSIFTVLLFVTKAIEPVLVNMKNYLNQTQVLLNVLAPHPCQWVTATLVQILVLFFQAHQILEANFAPMMLALGAMVSMTNYAGLLEAVRMISLPILSGDPESCKTLAATCASFVLGGNRTQIYSRCVKFTVELRCKFD